MKNPKVPPTPSSFGLPETGDVSDKDRKKIKLQAEPSGTDDTVDETDRPGFDLGGSSGDTHAGTGLGLGTDAFDTPGDRRLPGRRLDNKLTIPRWGGPEPRDTTASDEKTAGAETPSAPETKKAR